MPISRRDFLGYAAGASVAGVAGARGLSSFLPEVARRPSGCLVVDPGPACPLRESAAGYAAALSRLRIPYRAISIDALAHARTMFVPAAVSTEPVVVTKLKNCLESGSVVLYETGAAFLEPEEFGIHKRVIRSVFGVSLHDPVRLWDSADSFKQAPYVDYCRPVITKVRDFSRVVPVSGENAETIAWFGELSVAVQRRIGRGKLVFLGSPLGPHLLSDDREALGWLGAFCRSC
ncbi:MAG TPA: twin-arginine translocation signal domain-containing protein [Terriglobia bacterium]|nr:twin-arginine translocation signal domain-containing protein [Terriglobia bacterium]